MKLFSYGSNNPEQLSRRLGRPVTGKPAYLPHYRRVYRGWSKKWGGAVGSLEADQSSLVYGYVEEVTEIDLITLDRYEGVATGFYRRELLEVRILTLDSELQEIAVAYICNKPEEGTPSEIYLAAVAATENSFWTPDRHPKFATMG